MGILLAQALLSARGFPGPDQDEALYTHTGKLIWDGFLQGVPTTHWGAHGFFSGAPELYPVLAGRLDSAFGLTGVRTFSLLCMLATTGLLYLITRQLFGGRTALWTAAMYAVLPSVLELNVLATYDAPAVALLALACWIAVRCGPSRAYVLAAPVAALAIAVKYAALMFLPAIAVLAALTALRHRGRWHWPAAARALVLPALVAAVLGAAMALFGTAHLQGARSTTTGRAQSADSAEAVLRISLQLGGWLFALAGIGAVLYALRDPSGTTPGRWWRVTYASAMVLTAVLVPLYQAHLHTTVALGKHLAYALLFVAPLAGLAIDRFVGPYLPNLLCFLVAAGLVGLAVYGTNKATDLSRWFPDTSELARTLEPMVNAKGKYLAEPGNPMKYYFSETTAPDQWTELTWIDYTDPQGRKRQGFDAYRSAIRNGHFDLAVLDDHPGHDMSQRLIPELEKSGKYRLERTVANEDNSGPGEFQVWVRE
ncbi:glycosyltransferase family 39 protein [Streptomyces mesophilus]|uniref:glycosyltransferase family 39 protein n=1 Tax=Streptomyces mesophilus TaxID=1775132 RepID=UPI00331D20B7